MMKPKRLPLAIAALWFPSICFAGLPVIDASAIAQAVARIAQAGLQHGQTIAHYALQILHWEQQLISLKARALDYLQIPQFYTKIPKMQDAPELCGTNGGLAGELHQFMSNPLNLAGDLGKTQEQICLAKVANRNQMYNEAVEYFSEMELLMKELRKTHDSMLLVGASPGNAGFVEAELSRLQLKMESMKADFESHIAQAEAVGAMLDRRQSAVGRQIMAGRPTILGSVVEAGILAAALRI
jgi:hypothetical protein